MLRSFVSAVTAHELHSAGACEVPKVEVGATDICLFWLAVLQLCGEVGNPGGAGNIAAAHIIDNGKHQQAHDAGLLSTCEVRNGIPLCGDCHKYFDKQSLWTFRADGDHLVAEVSDALKLHPSFATKWCVALLDTA